MLYKFNDEIHSYQKFVRDNIRMLGNLKIISEQLYVDSNNKKSFLDMLAIDLDSNRIVILELKNKITGDDIVGQPIKYYDLLVKGKIDLELLVNNAIYELGLNIDKVDYNPKVMLVMPGFDIQIINLFNYVNNIDFEIVKFNMIKKNNYYEIVKESFYPKSLNNKVNIKNKLSIDWDFNKYIENNININKVNLARQTINYINFICKGNNFNYYFYENKISLIINRKVWGHIIINKKNNDYLELNIKYNGNKISNYNLLLNGKIDDYKFFNNYVKIVFRVVPKELLNKIIMEVLK